MKDLDYYESGGQYGYFLGVVFNFQTPVQLRQNIITDDVISTVILITLSLSLPWSGLINSAMVDAIIGGLCSWGVRCKKKAEEEKYQVHRWTFFL